MRQVNLREKVSWKRKSKKTTNSKEVLPATSPRGVVHDSPNPPSFTEWQSRAGATIAQIAGDEKRGGELGGEV